MIVFFDETYIENTNGAGERIMCSLFLRICAVFFVGLPTVSKAQQSRMVMASPVNAMASKIVSRDGDSQNNNHHLIYSEDACDKEDDGCGPIENNVFLEATGLNETGLINPDFKHLKFQIHGFKTDNETENNVVRFHLCHHTEAGQERD